MPMSFDPFSEMDRFAASLLDNTRAPRVMPVDLYRQGDQYILTADLPGVDPKSVDIDIDGQLLTIRADRSVSNVDGVKWLANERPRGLFLRQFNLGEGVDTESIRANCENGVLTVVIPVSEKAKPRKIEITDSKESTKQLINV